MDMEQQNKALERNATYSKAKISVSDDYINIEIADVVKAYLISNQRTKHQPTDFIYNELSAPYDGTGVFWQVITDVTQRV
jgi:hypothetical protein